MARYGERGQRAQDHRHRGCRQSDAHRSEKRVLQACVLGRFLHPSEGRTRWRPSLGAAGVERVNDDQRQRYVAGKISTAIVAASSPSSAKTPGHQSDSNAPSRRAISRYTIMITSGTSDWAAASGRSGYAEVRAEIRLPMNCSPLVIRFGVM